MFCLMEKSFEFIRPRTKNILETPIKYKFKFPEFLKGQTPKIKNTIKNNKPKLLFELEISF